MVVGWEMEFGWRRVEMRDGNGLPSNMEHCSFFVIAFTPESCPNKRINSMNVTMYRVTKELVNSIANGGCD